MPLPADLINLATNPTAASTTNYAAIAGTGGTAALTNQVTAGFSGSNFNRTTWTVATTSPSGGQSYLQTGLAAATAYQLSIYVRASKAQTVSLKADFETSSSTIVNTVFGGTVALLANTWTRLTILGTSGASVDRVLMTVAAASSGVNWANTDTLDLDAVQIILAPTAAARTNLVTNPSSGTATTGYSALAGTSGVAAITRVTAGGSTTPTFARCTWSTGTTAPSGGILYGSTTGLTAAQTYTASIWVRSSVAQSLYISVDWNNAGGGYISTTASGAVAVLANTWTRINVTGTAPALTTQANISGIVGGAGANWAIGGTLDMQGVLLETGPTLQAFFDGNTAVTTLLGHSWTGASDASTSIEFNLTAYFDGSLPPDSSYRYFWTSTANASTSHAEYRGIWVENVTGPPCPRVQVTVSGLGLAAGLVQVTRTADGETWTVPGWYNRSVVDTDTDTDFAVPLGRNVTYTLFFNGAQIGQMSITVTSTTGWVQSPYDPAGAMPINTLLSDPAVLTLAKGALDSRTHASNASKATVMGSKRPHSISGQRLVDGSTMFILHAWKNATSDQFKTMATAPILLIRGLPSWGSLPGLAYTDAPAQEYAVSRYKNYPLDGLTQWVISGDLVQPISRKPLTGAVTNDQVQANLTGVTYNTILARSGSKKNVDIKANPLGL